MKKIFIIPLFAFVFATSCVKDRTCTCVSTRTNSPNTFTSTKTLVGVSKSQAKSYCVDTKSENNGVTFNTDCTLN